MTVPALDLSFDAPKVTPEWCARRIAEGITLLIADGWTGRTQIDCEQALRLWREAGGITALYFVVHDGRLAEEHFAQGKAAAGEEWPMLAFVAVDVEVDVTTAPTVNAACELVEADGLRAIVYSRRGFWQHEMKGTMECAGRLLWTAQYDDLASLDGATAYGGMTVAGKQYANTLMLDGINVCPDVFSEAFVLGEGDSGMDKVRIARMLDVLWGNVNKLEPVVKDTIVKEMCDAIVAIKEEVGLP